MPLLDVFDHHVVAAIGRADDLAGERAQLLRQRLAARLVPALGDDEHSVGVPALGGCCERAFRLYVLGFPEPAIIEAHARVASLLRAWLDRRGPAIADETPGALARAALAAGLVARDDDVVAGLTALDERRLAIDRRDRDLAESVVGAAERGAPSAGLAAVRAESPTSQRLRWMADLHDLLAVVALSCARVLAAVAAEAHA